MKRASLVTAALVWARAPRCCCAGSPQTPARCAVGAAVARRRPRSRRPGAAVRATARSAAAAERRQAPRLVESVLRRVS